MKLTANSTPLIKRETHFQIFSVCCFFSLCSFQAALGVHVSPCALRSEAYLGPPSATGTIARSSKRSAAVMWVEGAPLAAGWCCFWPRPHSSADCTAQAQLVGCRSVCLSVCPNPPTHPRPPAAPPHPSHHLQLALTGRRAAQLSYRKWGKKKKGLECWSILWRHHAIIASSLRTIHTLTRTRDTQRSACKRSACCNTQREWYQVRVFVEGKLLSHEPPTVS